MTMQQASYEHQSSGKGQGMFLSSERPKKTRKMFSAIFKQQIAEIVMSSPALTYSAIGRQYGVTCHQVSRWYKEYSNPDTLWVQELNTLTKNHKDIEKTGTELSVIQTLNSTTPSTEAATFAIDVSLPSGTKVCIANLTTDQLQAVLRICKWCVSVLFFTMSFICKYRYSCKTWEVTFVMAFQGQTILFLYPLKVSSSIFWSY